ncbi:hypothetical protein CFOL_v3_20502 [Cephalotus follicularis]|uniref:Uncharacterized protein n=1 Tax=Cephalotus follicularis TaxID=3775 RepID=A0A1Q3C9V1_CEPFO|nr:hypothetical protein CFOL_v3_20502 [Cephalotus follicularis]
MDIASSYTYLLGRPWIHSAGGVPSSLYQKLKFISGNKQVIISGEEELLVRECMTRQATRWLDVLILCSNIQSCSIHVTLCKLYLIIGIIVYVVSHNRSMTLLTYMVPCHIKGLVVEPRAMRVTSLFPVTKLFQVIGSLI